MTASRFTAISSPFKGFELTEEQQEELAQALAEADRGEGVDGWQFLAELRRS